MLSISSVALILSSFFSSTVAFYSMILFPMPKLTAVTTIIIPSGMRTRIPRKMERIVNSAAI
jgi:hypothetical protein